MAELTITASAIIPVSGYSHDTIIAGHGRVQAASLNRMDRVPVIVLAGLSDRQQRELMLADNKIALNAGWNVDLLRQELSELRDDGADLEALGFAAAEVDDLLPAEPEANVEEIDISPVQDRFWIVIRGPLSARAEALAAMKAATAGVGGVTVELGTISDG